MADVINLRETIVGLLAKDIRMSDTDVICAVRRMVYAAGGVSADIPRVHDMCDVADELRKAAGVVTAPVAAPAPLPVAEKPKSAPPPQARSKESGEQFEKFVKTAVRTLRSGEKAEKLSELMQEKYPEFRNMSPGARKEGVRRAIAWHKTEEEKLGVALSYVKKHEQLGGKVSPNPTRFAEFVFEGPAKPECSIGLLTVACARFLKEGADEPPAPAPISMMSQAMPEADPQRPATRRDRRKARREQSDDHFGLPPKEGRGNKGNLRKKY
jgi:hypothetical protein